MKILKNVLTTRRSNRGLFLKLSVFALFGIMILFSGQTLAQTPTPTPTRNVCTPSVNVQEDPALMPGGPASFPLIMGGPGTLMIQHVPFGTGLQSITVMSQTNAIVDPIVIPGPFLKATVTFTVINPNLPVTIVLKAQSQFHGVIITLQCACTPTISVMEDPAFMPGGLASFPLITGVPGVSVTIDHVGTNAAPFGTGLRNIVLVNQTNAVVNLPSPATYPTYDPVVVTYTITNSSLPVDITLRARSSFHGVLIRIRCGTTVSPELEEGKAPELEEGKDSN